VQLVPLDAIRIPANRLRTRVEIDGLRESIAANGLLQPVLLDASMTLVCGLHRLEACRELGWPEIPAVLQPWSATEARLAEIDENLCRRELNVLERAEHIALRKRLWEELRAARASSETPPPKAKRKGGAKEELTALAAFVDDTAKRTGRANTVVREEIRIGELPEEVRSLAREMPLSNNRRELLALTRMAEEEQREAIERVRTGEAKSVRKRTPKPSAAGEMSVEPEAAPESAPVREREPAGPPTESLLSSDALRDRLRAIMDADEPGGATGEASGASEGLRALREALEQAQRALERAQTLWPADESVGDDGEASGPEVLRQAARAVRRLADEVRQRGR
jgi:ParB family chromosome partitioning protein